ncbi:MAG: succinate dehydrogenase, hydrophobic membrane anchor protein [Pseudomonadota bacterium]
MSSAATKHFVMQRFTAMIQVPLVIWLVISLVRHARDTHTEVMAWIGEPLTAGLMILLMMSVFYHMHLGMAEVIDDYIHKKTGRSALMMLNILFALILAAIGIFSVIAITLIV